jgi:hypothetical protein
MIQSQKKQHLPDRQHLIIEKVHERLRDLQILSVKGILIYRNLLEEGCRAPESSSLPALLLVQYVMRIKPALELDKNLYY